MNKFFTIFGLLLTQATVCSEGKNTFNPYFREPWVIAAQVRKEEEERVNPYTSYNRPYPLANVNNTHNSFPANQTNSFNPYFREPWVIAAEIRKEEEERKERQQNLSTGK